VYPQLIITEVPCKTYPLQIKGGCTQTFLLKRQILKNVW